MGALTNAANGRGLGGRDRKVLAERMAKSKEVLLAVMRFLGHSHAAAYERENLDVLEEQTLLAARFYAETSPGNPKPHVIDVAAMAVIRAGLDASHVRRIFGGVALESDLADPVHAGLSRDGFSVKREVPVRDSRADLVAYGKPFIERQIVLIELKNAPEECERLQGQVADYRRAADLVRVVMTPECLARVALSRNELKRPLAYLDFVSKMGAELWVYDAAETTFEKLSTGTGSYSSADYDALWDSLTKEAAA
jgi:hypothetical protein